MLFRSQENRADQFAITALDATKQSPKGLYTFFERLSGQELLTTDRQDPYMMTHPLTRSRMDVVENAVKNSPYTDKPLDPAFKGWGRCPTDKDGMFEFTTLKPGAVPGPGNTLQAPHLAITIFMRGQLKHLFTRMYFADEAANADDPILALVEDKARRETLIARKEGEGRYRWDVILQGKNETVFFDC